MSGRRVMVECWMRAARLCLGVAELADTLWGLVPHGHIVLTGISTTSEIEALECLIEAARLSGLGSADARRTIAHAIMAANWGLDPEGARGAVGRAAEALLRETPA